MASVPVPNTAMVEHRYLLEGEPAENTLYFLSADGFDPTSLEALGTAMRTWWVDNIQPLQSVHASLREVFVTDLTTPTSAAVGVSSGLPLSGDVTGEMMSANVAPCISFRTANRGRSFRGRNYLMGISVDSIAGNEILTPFQNAMVAAYEALIPVAGALDLTWVVVSRYSGIEIVGGKKKPIPREVGLSTPVTSVLFTDNIVDSQRKRLPNH